MLLLLFYFMGEIGIEMFSNVFNVGIGKVGFEFWRLF